MCGSDKPDPGHEVLVHVYDLGTSREKGEVSISMTPLVPSATMVGVDIKILIMYICSVQKALYTVVS